ncbi:MAG TPA: hypothetical protein VN950_13115 [Terriglobales bacterium]|nr:hypothetical protein [Terriglobales bacterium]
MLLMVGFSDRGEALAEVHIIPVVKADGRIREELQLGIGEV